jgi:hypothetical protein
MRAVEIVEEHRNLRRWVAIDAMTGQALIRIHDRELLERVCRKLDWKIVHTNVEPRQSGGA